MVNPPVLIVDDEVVIWGDNSFNASFLENISKSFTLRNIMRYSS